MQIRKVPEELQRSEIFEILLLGLIPKKVFIETLCGLVNLNLGINCFPDAWKNLTLADVGLWFNGNEDLSITENCEESVSLERLKHLIKFFFHLFADTKKDPALLDYIEMLLYFASHSDPVEGVYRALSVATGTYIHRKKKASLPCVDSSSLNILSNEKTLKEDEKEVLNYTGEGIISVASLLKVFHTGGSKDEDYHRFSCLVKEDSYDKHFIKMYQELGAEDLTPIAVELLLKHPFMEDLINTCQEYKLPDIKVFLQGSKGAQSTDGEQDTCEDINV